VQGLAAHSIMVFITIMNVFVWEVQEKYDVPMERAATYGVHIMY